MLLQVWIDYSYIRSIMVPYENVFQILCKERRYFYHYFSYIFFSYLNTSTINVLISLYFIISSFVLIKCKNTQKHQKCFCRDFLTHCKITDKFDVFASLNLCVKNTLLTEISLISYMYQLIFFLFRDLLFMRH